MAAKYFNPPLGPQPNDPKAGEPGSLPAEPAAPIPSPPEAFSPSGLAEQVRQSHRELRQLANQVATERAQLEHVRSVLAAQRLTLKTNEEQIARQRGELTGELARLQATVANLAGQREALDAQITDRREELDRTLGQRQAELERQVIALELRHRELDEGLAGRQAEFRRYAAELAARARKARDDAAMQANDLIAKGRAAAEQLTKQAQEALDRAKASAERDTAEFRAVLLAQAREKLESAQIEAARLAMDSEAQVAAAKEEAARVTSSSKAEAARVALAAKAEADRLTSLAKADAARVTSAAEAEAERLTSAATTEADQVTSAAKAEAQGVTSAARAEANRLTTSTQAAADALAASARAAAEKLTATTVADMAARREAAEAERTRQERELASRIKAADVARAEAEVELASRVDLARRKTAEVESRIAAVAEGEKTLAEGEASLSQRREEFAKAQADFATHQRAVAQTRQRLQKAEAAFSQRVSKLEADLARRAAEADSTTATLEELERSLSQRQKDVEAVQAGLAGQRESIRRQQAEVDREAAARRAKIAAVEAEVAATREAIVAQKRDTQARNDEVRQKLAELEAEAKRLAEAQELARRQHAEAERLAHDLESRGDAIKRTERDVLSGWEEVRLAKASLAAAEKNLEERRKEVEALGRPIAPAPAAVEQPRARLAWQRINWPVYRRWATAIGVCAGVVLMVVEFAIWAAVRPSYHSVGWMDVRAFPVAASESIEPAATIAMRELEAFTRETERLPHEKSAGVLAGDRWRIELGKADGSSESARLVVHGWDSSEKLSRAAADVVMKGYLRWRDGKVSAIRQGHTIEELDDSLKSAKADCRVAANAEAAAKKQLCAQAGLADNQASDAVLGAIKGRLAEIAKATTADEESLARESLAQLKVQTELAQLREAGVVDAKADAGIAARALVARLGREVEMREREAAGLEKSIALDKERLARDSAEQAQYRAQYAGELKTAEREWTAASDALVEALKDRNTRSADETIAAATQRFEKAQIAYTKALRAADPNQSLLVRTLTDNMAKLTDGIARSEGELRNLRTNIAQCKRYIELKESAVAGKAKVDELASRIEQQRAKHLELVGLGKAFEERARQLKAANAARDDLERRFIDVKGVAMARVTMGIVQAEVVSSRNARPIWMLTGAAIVLVLTMLAGVLSLMFLARPKRAGAPRVEAEPAVEAAT
ncbi:MAG: hypothetical protein PHU85_00820 [Phycisphaerae bacterium]|nr:hypothetical protein [Phycisphaerae bacterium]